MGGWVLCASPLLKIEVIQQRHMPLPESQIFNSCMASLAFLLVVSIFSRMTMAESKLGAYSKEQVNQTIRRLVQEGKLKSAISRQDVDPLIALLHNAEAAAHYQAGKKLAEECGMVQGGYDFIDLLADLGTEQESILRVLTQQMG